VQRGPYFADGRVHPVFSVDEDVPAPKPINDLGPRHDPAFTLDQQSEQFQRNAFDLDGLAVAQKLEPVPVQFKVTESVDTVVHSRSSGKRGEPL